jgi:hypothetical protein
MHAHPSSCTNLLVKKGKHQRYDSYKGNWNEHLASPLHRCARLENRILPQQSAQLPAKNKHGGKTKTPKGGRKIVLLALRHPLFLLLIEGGDREIPIRLSALSAEKLIFPNSGSPQPD